MAHDLVGQQIGKYRIEGLIAYGGMAAVYRGRDTMLDRDVAIKVLEPGLAHDPAAAERFRREAITAANLEHPNIVPVYDVREMDGLSYIAMRYVPGETLRERLRREGRLPLDQIGAIVRALAAALTYAHRRGVIHRDVKPGNILLEPDGRVLLADFGIARTAGQSRVTATGEVVGTVQYLAPELIQGAEAGPGSDIYALGVVLYEMLTGRLPFAGDDLMSILYRQIQDPPPGLSTGVPAVDAALGPIVERALAKLPALRYPTPDALAADLTRALAALPPGTTLTPARRAPSPLPVAPRVAEARPAAEGAAVEPALDPTTRTTTPVQVAPRRGGGRQALWLGGVALFLLGALVLGVGALRRDNSGGGGGGGEPGFDAPVAVTYEGPLRKDNGADIHLGRARRPPVIDGDLADWKGATAFAPRHLVLNQGWKNVDDLTALFGAAYDADSFYIAVVVTDDVHVQHAKTRGGDLWRGDDVELWFDLKLADDFTRDPGDADDWQIGLSPGDFADLTPEAIFFMPKAQAAPNIRVAARPRGKGGYFLEAAIPWKDMSFQPVPGSAIGFAASVGDNDHPNTATQEHMFSTARRLRWNVPTTLGNLFF